MFRSLFGGRSSGDPFDTIGALLGAIERPMTNLRRMAACHMLWKTQAGAVGVCPGVDDFIVWLRPDSERALAVPATATSISDFRENVLPAIARHAKASVAVDLEGGRTYNEWVLDLLEQVEAGTLKDGDPLPPMQETDDLPAMEEVRDEAHAAVMTALRGFLDRNEHTPDLV